MLVTTSIKSGENSYKPGEQRLVLASLCTPTLCFAISLDIY